MKKIIFIFLLFAKLFPSEDFNEIFSFENMYFKIGVNSWYNNICYNGKYLTNWNSSLFFQKEINTQYKFNSHFSSGFSVEVGYKQLRINYYNRLIENNLSIPYFSWVGGQHQNAYEVELPKSVF